jgi:hypothetical protein
MADAQACTAETTFIAKGNRLKIKQSLFVPPKILSNKSCLC